MSKSKTPVEVEPVEVAQEAVEAPVETSEPVEVVAEAPKPVQAQKVADVPHVVRAEAGDSYLAIAVRYFPDRAPGVVAPELVKLNLNRPLREGVKVFLKENR